VIAIDVLSFALLHEVSLNPDIALTKSAESGNISTFFSLLEFSITILI